MPCWISAKSGFIRKYKPGGSCGRAVDPAEEHLVLSEEHLVLSLPPTCVCLGLGLAQQVKEQVNG